MSEKNGCTGLVFGLAFGLAVWAALYAVWPTFTRYLFLGTLAALIAFACLSALWGLVKGAMRP